MLVTLLVIGIAFYWMLRETDYLRVHLLVGPEAIIHPLEWTTWEDIRAGLGKARANDVMFLRFPDIMAPLCGWDYLTNTKHVIPECRLEVDYGGVRYKMIIKDYSILKDLVSAMKATPEKATKQVHYGRNAAGGLRCPLPAKAR